ncbi:hypothetical protein D5R40_18870 [Okeania hirsuta]|uniref:Transposase DDE domain-containing protein n=2 Tax=Okeania hirsuta TaxID=1458930 RepID=A0A3N6PHY0_9CYAN|nr:hypothetical protein D5R40_18870 [Okeania hirsuta]
MSKSKSLYRLKNWSEYDASLKQRGSFTFWLTPEVIPESAKNWSEYDASLKQRGSFTFWLTPEVIPEWLNQKKTGPRGASNNYSDTAIEFMVTIQSWFSLAGRQTLMFCGTYI